MGRPIHKSRGLGGKSILQNTLRDGMPVCLAQLCTQFSCHYPTILNSMVDFAAAYTAPEDKISFSSLSLCWQMQARPHVVPGPKFWQCTSW